MHKFKVTLYRIGVAGQQCDLEIEAESEDQAKDHANHQIANHQDGVHDLDWRDDSDSPAEWEWPQILEIERTNQAA